MICSICENPIEVVGTWELGGDAWPVTDGRCCNTCDETVVLTARLQDMMKRRKKEEDNE